jgi:hypothetical protein
VHHSDDRCTQQTLAVSLTRQTEIEPVASESDHAVTFVLALDGSDDVDDVKQVSVCASSGADGSAGQNIRYEIVTVRAMANKRESAVSDDSSLAVGIGGGVCGSFQVDGYGSANADLAVRGESKEGSRVAGGKQTSRSEFGLLVS